LTNESPYQTQTLCYSEWAESERIFNGASAQLGYTVSFTSIPVWKSRYRK